MKRIVHVALDIGADDTSFRLSAECDDELTEMVMLNGSPSLFGFASFEAMAEGLKGELGAMLVSDHHGRCTSCQGATS